MENSDRRLVLLSPDDNCLVVAQRLRAGDTVTIEGEPVTRHAHDRRRTQARPPPDPRRREGTEVRCGHRHRHERHRPRRARPHPQPRERLPADVHARRGQVLRRAALIMEALRGYPRSDGRKGIRNVVAVAYLVECAHHVAREVVARFRDRGRPPDRLPRLLPERVRRPHDEAALHASERRRGAARVARLRELQPPQPRGDDRRLGPAGRDARDPGSRRHPQDDRARRGVGRGSARASSRRRNRCRWP